ncbi:MAG: hypothetical protein QNK37_10435 [Acidobacteriota bacterium]|nr:hypothetical protein [Acidobacteriota bacterium]
MTTIQLPLDEETLNRARLAASRQDADLETMIVNIVVKLAQSQETADPFHGMFGDEPELVDQVVSEAFDARERDTLR